MNLKDHIRGIPDFPKPGILFYDISTLIAHPEAWAETVEQLAAVVAPWRPTKLVGIESRGFLTAAPLALKLGLGFVMIRKKGKLPGDVVSMEYALEYGTDVLEIQVDAVEAGDRIVVLDDLLATGGTMVASINLLKSQGADVVGSACILELTFLEGRKRLDCPVQALLQYDS
jgi:adenine phosphoribosyltransferase